MPLPIGALISGALQVGGSIYGGIKAAQANKQIADNLAKRQRENQSWFDRRYNEDATQRADAQRLMELTRKRIAERNQQAAGRAAVMGGDDAGLAATKQANNEAIADTASRIAASADARKDTIEQTYIGNKNAIADSQNAMEAAKAENIAKAVSGVSDAAGHLAGAGGETTSGTTATPTATATETPTAPEISDATKQAYADEWGKQFGKRKGFSL